MTTPPSRVRRLTSQRTRDDRRRVRRRAMTYMLGRNRHPSVTTTSRRGQQPTTPAAVTPSDEGGPRSVRIERRSRQRPPLPGCHVPRATPCAPHPGVRRTSAPPLLGYSAHRGSLGPSPQTTGTRGDEAWPAKDAVGLGDGRDPPAGGPTPGYRHDALVHDGSEQLTSTGGPWLLDGLTAGDAAVIAVEPQTTGPLREAVGDHPRVLVLDRQALPDTHTHGHRHRAPLRRRARPSRPTGPGGRRDRLRHHGRRVAGVACLRSGRQRRPRAASAVGPVRGRPAQPARSRRALGIGPIRPSHHGGGADARLKHPSYRGQRGDGAVAVHGPLRHRAVAAPAPLAGCARVPGPPTGGTIT